MNVFVVFFLMNYVTMLGPLIIMALCSPVSKNLNLLRGKIEGPFFTDFKYSTCTFSLQCIGL